MPGVLIGALLAQAAISTGPDATELDRIRRALANEPVLIGEARTDDSEPGVIRMKIRGWTFERAVWHEDTVVPPYVRSWWRGYHYEFLKMVTPEEFRSATLYPCCIPVLTVTEALKKHFRETRRKAQEKDARDEVSQALADVLACRADPTRPGC